MNILVTGGSGVLGRPVAPRLRARGHEVAAPSRHDLDLSRAKAVVQAVRGTGAIYHLATSIPPPHRRGEASSWLENDRLRAEAARVLVDAALRADTAVYIQPTVAFVYPPGPADEDTPVADVPDYLRSALVAEAEALRLTDDGRAGIVLRLGLLYGPGTSTPRDTRFGATLHVEDAGRALVAALTAPGGIYNVVENDNRVSNARFRYVTGWSPRR